MGMMTIMVAMRSAWKSRTRFEREALAGASRWRIKDKDWVLTDEHFLKIGIQFDENGAYVMQGHLASVMRQLCDKILIFV